MIGTPVGLAIRNPTKTKRRYPSGTDAGAQGGRRVKRHRTNAMVADDFGATGIS